MGVGVRVWPLLEPEPAKRFGFRYSAKPDSRTPGSKSGLDRVWKVQEPDCGQSSLFAWAEGPVRIDLERLTASSTSRVCFSTLWRHFMSMLTTFSIQVANTTSSWTLFSSHSSFVSVFMLALRWFRSCCSGMCEVELTRREFWAPREFCQSSKGFFPWVMLKISLWCVFHHPSLSSRVWSCDIKASKVRALTVALFARYQSLMR